MSAINDHLLKFIFSIKLTLTVDTALSPLSVNIVLFTVTGAISPVIVNVYTNGSVYINGCYIASFPGYTVPDSWDVHVPVPCAGPEGGLGVSDPLENHNLEKVGPPPPPENVGSPLDPWKSIVFSVIKPLDALCKL